MTVRTMLKNASACALHDAAGTHVPRAELKALTGTGAELRTPPPSLRIQRDGLFRRDILD
jgi:hypothetical protein